MSLTLLPNGNMTKTKLWNARVQHSGVLRPGTFWRAPANPHSSSIPHPLPHPIHPTPSCPPYSSSRCVQASERSSPPSLKDSTHGDNPARSLEQARPRQPQLPRSRPRTRVQIGERRRGAWCGRGGGWEGEGVGRMRDGHSAPCLGALPPANGLLAWRACLSPILFHPTLTA